MSDVLTQSEIDSLLKALNSGEVDAKEIKEEAEEKKVRKYDFRNPQKIAKDQLRTLEIIHDNFGRLLQTFLSGHLRAPVKVNILTVDQYAFSEFSNAISNPSFLSIVKLEPLPGEIVTEISPRIAFAAIDRLLGGDGEKMDEIRIFTEIELIILEKIMQKVLNLASKAWEDVIPLKPTLEKIETNSQFTQIISPTETIALVTMNISIGSVEGMINICIPHLTLEPIQSKLSTKMWFANTKSNIRKDEIQVMEKRLKNVPVQMSAKLGFSELTVKELLDLQIGDVIKLDNKKNDEIEVTVKSKTKFYGIPGTSNKKLSVKITRIKKDGDEIYD